MHLHLKQYPEKIISAFKKLRKRGFTLIELMVVITILAILSTVGISIYSGAIKRTNQVKIRSDLETIAKTYETGFVPETNTYVPLDPADFQGGQIPAPPGGGSYIVYGPNNQSNPKSDGFAVCGDFNTGQACYTPSPSCLCKTSTKGQTDLVVLLATPTPAPTGTPLPSATPELLGNPFTPKPTYARNVWDMQKLGTKIFLGYGNSSNNGPPGSENAGPITVRFYETDPGASGGAGFKTETVSNGTYTPDASEEQIDTFRVLDSGFGQDLHFAGHDARDFGTNGPIRFYRRQSGTWQSISNTSANVAHNYDLFTSSLAGGLLFRSGGGSANWANSATIPVSAGATWTGVSQSFGSRSYYFFQTNTNIYLGGEISVYDGVSFVPAGHIARWNGTNFMEVSSSDDDAFFRVNINAVPCPTRVAGYCKGAYKVIRPVLFNNNSVYIGARRVNDHQWIPLNRALFAGTGDISSTNQPIHIPAASSGLPSNLDWKSWDLLVDGTTLYVLGSYPDSAQPGNQVITVHSTTDLTNWNQPVNFSYPTFARSFEYLNGYFYFGMGSHWEVGTELPRPQGTETIPVTTAQPNTGEIVRYRYP